VHRAIVISHGYVFTRDERVITKPVTDLVVILPRGIIIKPPPRPLNFTWHVDEAPDLIVFIGPESAHAAMIAVLTP
jgi:hypothetical protein